MGGWALEIGKMAMYMSFPVGMFYYFNQPEYFEKWVTQTRRELYPPENKSHRDEIENCIRAVRETNDKKLMKALEDIEKRDKNKM